MESCRASTSATNRGMSMKPRRPFKKRFDGDLVCRHQSRRGEGASAQRPASIASDKHRKPPEVDLIKTEAANPRKIEMGDLLHRQAIRIGQRALYRQAHVRIAELRFYRTIRKLHQRVDDTFAMQHHFNLRQRHIEQPSRFDGLEALVEQRGRESTVIFWAPSARWG